MVLNTDMLMPDGSTEPTGSVQKKKKQQQKRDHFTHEMYDSYLFQKETGAPHDYKWSELCIQYIIRI